MIKHIEELYEEIVNTKDTKEWDIKHLITLNVLIECKFINKELRWFIRSLEVGDEEDIEFNRHILQRTIENVIEGKYSCFR